MLKGNFFNAAANNDAFIYHAGMEEESTFTREALRAFGYNSDDPYNPIGFYRFGGSTLGGNKAFIVLDEGSSAANIVIGDFGAIDKQHRRRPALRPAGPTRAASHPRSVYQERQEDSSKINIYNN